MSTPLDNRGPTPTESEAPVWIWTDGQVGGPFPIADVEALVASGEAPPGLLARVEGGEWMPWPDFRLRHQTEVTAPPEPPAPPATASRRGEPLSRREVAGVLGFCALMGMALFVWITMQTPDRGDPEVGTRSAYSAAARFLKEEFPGLGAISPLEESEVWRENGLWTVSVVANGKNAFGGPVRRRLEVKMRDMGDQFVRESIRQGPAPITRSVPIR